MSCKRNMKMMSFYEWMMKRRGRNAFRDVIKEVPGFPKGEVSRWDYSEWGFTNEMPGWWFEDLNSYWQKYAKYRKQHQYEEMAKADRAKRDERRYREIYH